MIPNFEVDGSKPAPQDLATLNAQILLDSAPAATIVVDHAGKVVGYNTLANALLGEPVACPRTLNIISITHGMRL